MDNGSPIHDAVEGEDAPTLPSTWRTLSDVARHVYPPGHLRADAEAGEAAALGAAPAGATVTLFDLFAHPTRRKRSRRGEDTGSSKTSMAGTSHAKVQGCCTAPLRKAVLAAITAARSSIGGSSSSNCGSKEDSVPSSVVVVVHLRSVPHNLQHSSGIAAHTKPARSGDAWCVDGVCVAEQRTRVSRAVLTGPRNCALPSPASSSCASSKPTARDVLSSLQATQMGTEWCPGTPLCGVRLVWVAPPYRRTGVARRLLEAARRSVCYGHEVPAAHVAFSEPTQMGSALARHYHKRDDFPVYAYDVIGEGAE